jgi:hypothetical protein
VAAPSKVDYERILPGWRAGVKSPDQLAAEYTAETGIKVSRQAIQKHFQKLRIPRDLTAQVRAKADAMVLEAGVTGKVQSKDLPPATAVVVEQAALDSAAIQLAHRVDIKRGREVVAQLQADLETIAGHQDVRSLLTGLSQRRQDDTDESHAERMAAAVESLTRSVNARANISARLIETMKGLIPLERQAWKIDTGGTPPPPPSAAESQSAEEAYKRMLGSV